MVKKKYLFCTITAGAANLAPGFQKPIAGADAEKSRLRVFFVCVCVCAVCVYAWTQLF